VRAGELEILLAGDEEPSIPVHVLAPNGRLAMPKARAFVDFAVPRLRSYFVRSARDAEETATRSGRGNVSTEHVIASAEVSGMPMEVRQDVRKGPGRVPVPALRTPNFPHGHPMSTRLPSQAELLAVS
jgi:hypothetical protein